MNWAVILAGGNGSRLRSLTRALAGDDRPKQFCSLLGGQSLLSQTRSRISANVPAAQTLCVVTREHERYYERELADMRAWQIIEQPANRGTAAAIAYSIARLSHLDRKAVIGLFPADHFYEDTDTFRETVESAYRVAASRPERIFLLGTEPDSPEVEYGWIEPGDPLVTPEGRAFSVARFWEKPSFDTAVSLLARQCLWNMFVMVGTLGAFRTLLNTALPEMMRAFDLAERFPDARVQTVETIYDALEPADFSRDVLTHHSDRIGVLRVPSIGWTDLGQPARVQTFLSAHGASVSALSAAS